MSNQVAYKKFLGSIKDNPIRVQSWRDGASHWYALLDKKGKVRDHIPANNAKDARLFFGAIRRTSVPTGYRVERRERVKW